MSACGHFWPHNLASTIIRYSYWILSIFSAGMASNPYFRTCSTIIWGSIPSLSTISYRSGSFVPTSLGVISTSPLKSLDKYGMSKFFTTSSNSCKISSFIPSACSSILSYLFPWVSIVSSDNTPKLFLEAIFPPWFLYWCLQLVCPLIFGLTKPSVSFCSCSFPCSLVLFRGHS